MVFSLLLFVAILFSDEQDSGISNIRYGGVNVSAEVLAHKAMVGKYLKNMALKNMSTYFLRLPQVESGGTAERCCTVLGSPSGLPPNSWRVQKNPLKQV